jgi:tetratricopeptide (TPR) repeat protein
MTVATAVDANAVGEAEPAHEEAVPEEECAAWERFDAEQRRKELLQMTLFIAGVVLPIAGIAGWFWWRRRKNKKRASTDLMVGRTPISEDNSQAHRTAVLPTSPQSTEAKSAPSSAATNDESSHGDTRAAGVIALERAKELYGLKRYEEAQKALAAALAIGADPGECHYFSALAYMSVGNVVSAKQNLIATIRIAPRNHDAHFYLAELLAKDNSIDEAISHYYSTLSLKPDHVRAQKRIDEIRQRTTGRGPVAFFDTNPAPHLSSGRADDAPYLGDTYDLLRNSKDEASRAAVELIQKIRTPPRTPKMGAYWGTIVRFLAVFLIAMLVGNCLGDYGSNYERQAYDDHNRQAGNGVDIPVPSLQVLTVLRAQLAAKLRFASAVKTLSGIIAAASFLALIIFFYYYYRLAQTRMSIDRGVITLEKGFLSRHTTIHEIYRVTSFEAEQDLFNRLTGDASLVLDEGRKTTYLKGFAKYDETIAMAQQLRALHLLLRTTNIGKGIMQ